jgi:hypothetical protein
MSMPAIVAGFLQDFSTTFGALEGENKEGGGMNQVILTSLF